MRAEDVFSKIISVHRVLVLFRVFYGWRDEFRVENLKMVFNPKLGPPSLQHPEQHKNVVHWLAGRRAPLQPAEVSAEQKNICIIIHIKLYTRYMFF